MQEQQECIEQDCLLRQWVKRKNHLPCKVRSVHEFVKVFTLLQPSKCDTEVIMMQDSCQVFLILCAKQDEDHPSVPQPLLVNSPLLLSGHLGYRYTMISLQQHRRGFQTAQLRASTAFLPGASAASCATTLSKSFQNQRLRRAQRRQKPAQDQRQQLHVISSLGFYQPLPLP